MGALRDAKVTFYKLEGRWGYNLSLNRRGVMQGAQFHTKAGAWVSAWLDAQRLKS